jgi:AraC-like DNA-binding protein
MSEALAVSHAAFGRATLYRLDRPIIEHAHREGHLIFHISDATARMTVADTDLVLDGGTAVAVSPWEPHNFEIENRGAACSCLVLYINPAWFLQNAQFAVPALSFGRPGFHLTPTLAQLAMRLASALRDGMNDSDVEPLFFAVTHLAYQLSWDDAQQAPSAATQHLPALCDYRVKRSLRVLNAFVGDEIEMEEVARASGLSRPHFFKLFREQVGIPPTMYLNTLRSERAIERLISTDRTVAHISEELGFSSQASFSRFFAANVGIPPSAYRRVAHTV